jgi:ribosome-associated toxin RatA of RatAB toxin-antitoxin module
MGEISGERSVEIAAPIATCFAIAADIERAPEWQESLKDVEVVERDADKRAAVVETASDARVKTVRSKLRFSYEEPHTIDWVQEKGELKSLQGYWRFEELGAGNTLATYGLIVDPGRMLGMLLRGPAEAKVRDFLIGGAAEGLKSKAESG